MIDITAWMSEFLQKLDDTFGDRVCFVGLQGSYGRGEATESSDIDTAVILDELSALDIQTYSEMLDAMPHRELICGFLSGKDEIMNWEPSDLFQFCHDTTPIRGSLDELLALVDEAAVNRAIKIGVCNIFHGCVHNMLYEKSEQILRGLYKSASFVVQAIVFKQTGKYIRCQKDLLSATFPDEQIIVETFLDLKQGGAVDFDLMSETLFAWAKKWISAESLETLMPRRNYKKVAIHIAVSTAIFLVSFLAFPLAAEKIILPLSIPIILFWSILLIVGNFIAGITYGIMTKWGKLKLFCIAAYNVFLLFVLITTFAIAAVVFSVS